MLQVKKHLGEEMAIRIKNIKIDGKRVKNLGQVEVAKKVEKFINEMEGVEAEVQVSRYYADRWYPIDWIEKRIKEESERYAKEKRSRH